MCPFDHTMLPRDTSLLQHDENRTAANCSCPGNLCQHTVNTDTAASVRNIISYYAFISFV